MTADSTTAGDCVRDRLHDLRNLFGVVVSGTHLLADPQVEERREMVLTAMDGAATRGAQILSTLLAGLDGGTIETCLLPERIARLTPILTTMAGEGVHLRVDLSAQPVTVECAPDQFDRILLELVANARRAIGGSGRIEIRTRHAGMRLWVIVADTGAGISPRRLTRLRTRAGSVPRGANGTGLGQVRAFVAAAGGSLRIRSRIGCGTVVAMILPVRSQAATDICE